MEAGEEADMTVAPRYRAAGAAVAPAVATRAGRAAATTGFAPDAAAGAAALAADSSCGGWPA
ncbi:hypothetical protein BDI4_760014 [Burkholderia diffusa]|nr:hypothetical protein BDI4_760014 [Burkholderia diffusa]